MISYVHSTTVIVSDQNAAFDFYTNKLGFEKALDAPMSGDDRFLTVVPPGATTQIALSPARWFGPDRKAGGPTGISFVTSDVDGTYKTLTGRGVKFKGEPEMMPWGQKAAWFYDEDDNEFFLAEG
jgi:catechol 2,3-dioxygenase-like lactoylglutathione lyase family enzyme